MSSVCGVPEDWARFYIKRVQCSSMYTHSFEFVAMLVGYAVLVIAVSTATSTRVCYENMNSIRSGQVASEPYFHFYDAFVFNEKRVIGSVSNDMTDRQYSHPTYQLMPLVQFFDIKFGGMEWRKLAEVWPGRGDFLTNFRMFLKSSVAPVWIERMSGKSWKAFMGLDVYEKRVDAYRDNSQQYG